jgi:hypothetical protein
MKTWLASEVGGGAGGLVRGRGMFCSTFWLEGCLVLRHLVVAELSFNILGHTS